FGTALIYGDAMLTPAVSVLSAAEGLALVTPDFQPFVIPIAIAIVAVLFLLQKRGTSGVGALFAPVMVLWFTVLATLGVMHIARNPSVLAAANPAYAVAFFAENGWQGFVVLGYVFLAVT